MEYSIYYPTYLLPADGPIPPHAQFRWVTEEQYAAGVQLAMEWRASKKLVVRHCDVDPDRKEDPGEGFPWHAFLSDIKEENCG